MKIRTLVTLVVVLLLAGCREEEGSFETWRYFGKLYFIIRGSGPTGLTVYQIQGEKETLITDEKLVMDLEAATIRTIARRANPGVPVERARAATASAASVDVFVLDLADQFEKFDPVTKKITATLDLFGTGLPGQPIGMDITPDSKFAVVTKFAPPPNAPYALIIDLTTFKIASKINLPSGIVPAGVAITPDGLFAYIASTPYTVGNDSTVYVIDIAARSVLTSITISGNSSLDQIVMTPDGVSAYLASDFSYNSVIWVVDVATNTLALSALYAGLHSSAADGHASGWEPRLPSADGWKHD